MVLSARARQCEGSVLKGSSSRELGHSKAGGGECKERVKSGSLGGKRERENPTLYFYSLFLYWQNRLFRHRRYAKTISLLSLV